MKWANPCARPSSSSSGLWEPGAGAVLALPCVASTSPGTSHHDYQGYLLSREPSTLCGTGDWSLGRIKNSPKPCSGSGIQTTKQSLSLLHLTDTLTTVLLNLNCPRTPTPLPRGLWHQKLQNPTPRVYDSLGLGWGPFICISSKLPREADVHLWGHTLSSPAIADPAP